MSSLTKFISGLPARARVMFTGAGSGLYEPTGLTEGQRTRSFVLQDTRRSIDQITWRKLLAYGRQLHTNCGEIRGPVLERATLANSGGWLPRHVGKMTPKAVRDRYEAWAWNWMRVCDIRGQPYDFWTDMYLASVMFDRDGEAPVMPVVNANGDPRIQWIANHRIYSHWNIFTVMEPGPYRGMKFNNGVVYDDYSAPVAYYVLEESLQFAQAIKGSFVPVQSMMVTYNPDWCDQGRGVTAYAHAIKRIFDLDDINAYLLIGIKNDATLPIIEQTEGGAKDPGETYLSAGVSPGGTGITLEEMNPGGWRYFRAGSNSTITVPSSDRPNSNVPDYMESILVGAYQGLEWPYEYTRMSKEAKGANIRITVEKINHSVKKQYKRIERLAVRTLGYALGFAVNRGELPPGEWWAWEFPMPAEMTPDKWRSYQEDRENLKFGTTSLQRVCASYGYHWKDDLREEKDEEIDDLLTRCKIIQKKHPELTLQEVLDIYRQNSPNPQPSQPDAGDDDEPGPKKPAKKKQED